MRNYRAAAEAVRSARQGLPPAAPEGQVPHPRPPEPEPLAPPVCFTGTENGPLGDCPQSTTDTIYWDGHGHLVHKDLDTGKVSPEFDGDTPGMCWLPTDGADRSGCPDGTYDWRFPRGDDYVPQTKFPDGTVHTTVITPGTPLWN